MGIGRRGSRLADRALGHAPDHGGREVRSEVRKLRLKLRKSCGTPQAAINGVTRLDCERNFAEYAQLYDWVFSLAGQNRADRTLDVREYVGF